MGKGEDDQYVRAGESERAEENHVDDHNKENDHEDDAFDVDVVSQIGVHDHEEEDHEVVQGFEEHSQFWAFKTWKHK